MWEQKPVLIEALSARRKGVWKQSSHSGHSTPGPQATPGSSAVQRTFKISPIYISMGFQNQKIDSVGIKMELPTKFISQKNTSRDVFLYLKKKKKNYFTAY